MPWFSPHDLGVRRQRRLWLAAGALLGLIAASLADRWLFFHLRVSNLPKLEGKDWYRMLRVMGYLPTWLCISAVVLGADWPRSAPPTRNAAGPAPWWSPAALLLLAPALGGLAAEILKILFGRRRPIGNMVADGVYVWDGPLAPLKHHDWGYGLPSSHAGVAFGAAFIIGRLWPRAGPAALVLAAGCGLTRLLAGAHFTSDVYVAAIASYAVAACLWAMHTRARA